LRFYSLIILSIFLGHVEKEKVHTNQEKKGLKNIHHKKEDLTTKDCQLGNLISPILN
jgi:hypothetical protein